MSFGISIIRDTSVATQDDAGVFRPSWFTERVTAVYGDGDAYPKAMPLELGAADMSTAPWQSRVDATVEVGGCGSRLFDVRHATNIGDADPDLDPEANRTYAASNGVLRLRFENSKKSVAAVVDECLSGLKAGITGQETIETIGRHVARTPPEVVSQYIADRHQLRRFELRMRLNVYYQYLKKLKSQDKDRLDVLAETYLHAVATFRDYETTTTTKTDSPTGNGKGKGKGKGKGNGKGNGKGKGKGNGNGKGRGAPATDAQCFRWDLLCPLDDDDWASVLRSCGKRLRGYDFFRLQTTLCAHRLAPQDVFARRTPYLGAFHLTVVRRLRELVKARSLRGLVIEAVAGSGKTATVLTYLMAVQCRCLVVVPTNTLARQLTGDLSKQGPVSMLLPNAQTIAYPDAPMVVCTADAARDLLMRARAERRALTDWFDCLVVDEVHSLQQSDHQTDVARHRSKELLRLIKTDTPDVPFVMMSATLADPARWLADVRAIAQTDAVALVQHHFRSTALRHHVVAVDDATGAYALRRFNVIGLATLDFVRTGGLLESSMALAPEDVYDLYRACATRWPADVPAPPTALMTLFDIQDVEERLKGLIQAQADTVPDQVEALLRTYQVTNRPVHLNMHRLLKHLQAEKAYPGIMFTGSAEKTHRIVSTHLRDLRESEATQYPGRQEEHEWLAETAMAARAEVAERAAKVTVPKNHDPALFRQQQEDTLCGAALLALRQQFDTRVQHRLSKLARDMPPAMYPEARRFYDALRAKLATWDDLRVVDRWAVSEKFSYQAGTAQMLTDNEKRTYRRNISNAHNRNRKATGQQATRYGYDNLFMDGVERGLVHYSNDTAEQMCAQKICSEGKVPFFAGEELAEGVNFPIKTVVLLGGQSSLEPLDSVFVRQARGRAGRMGFFEKGGDVVYVNVDLAVLRSRLGVLREDRVNDALDQLPTSFLQLNVRDRTTRDSQLRAIYDRLRCSPNPGCDEPVDGDPNGDPHLTPHPTMPPGHRATADLVHRLRQVGAAAQVAPLLAVLLESCVDPVSATAQTQETVFHLLSIAFDPSLRLRPTDTDTDATADATADTLADWPRLSRIVGQLRTAGWTWDTPGQVTDLMRAFKRHGFGDDPLPVAEVIARRRRLDAVLAATQVFGNWHAYRDTVPATNVARIVHPVFDRMQALSRTLL
jgi:replicative superfamily II helicase